MEGTQLEVVEEEKDIGVIVHRSLKPSRQCKKAAGIATAVLRQLARNFHYRDKNTHLKTYMYAMLGLTLNLLHQHGRHG